MLRLKDNNELNELLLLYHHRIAITILDVYPRVPNGITLQTYIFVL